jgi:L-lysine 2,3-aminomutase
MEEEIRGTVSGHIMPHFVVDLPGGGGKRHACSYRDYSPTTGVAIYTASGLPGTKGQKTYEYHDPEWSLQSKTASKSTVGLREIGASYRDVVQPISTGPRRTRDTPIGLGHLAPTDQEDTTDELPEAISSYAHG